MNVLAVLVVASLFFLGGCISQEKTGKYYDGPVLLGKCTNKQERTDSGGVYTFIDYYGLDGTYVGNCSSYGGPGMSMKGNIYCTSNLSFYTEDGAGGMKYPCITDD